MRCAWGAWARGIGGGFALFEGFAVLAGKGTAKSGLGYFSQIILSSFQP